MFFEIVRMILVTVCCTASGLHSVHFLQTEKYQTRLLREHFRRPQANPILSNLIPMAIGVIAHWYLPVLLSMFIVKEEKRTTLSGWLVLALFVIMAAIVCWRKMTFEERKPFALTHRTLRLLIVVTLLNLLAVVTIEALGLPIYGFYVVTDYAVLVAALIMRPVENILNRRRYRTAQAKLARRKKLIRIGIAGSRGKTETKLILKTILSEKYKVLATPPAFSSSFGISRIVNEQLTKQHRVFIAEFGGEDKKEMREMAKLVAPRYGILTCVDERHRNTSMDEEAQMQNELINALPANGAAFFGADGSFCNRLYAKCRREKYRCGNAGNDIEPDIRVEDAVTDIHGSHFKLVLKDGTEQEMHTKLIGRHSLRDIALCAGVAIKLGLSLEQIAAGVEKIRSMRHRLELIEGEVNIIDDSGNETPETAESALEILKGFPGKRVFLCCGFENLTGHEDFEQKCFDVGLCAARCADYVILIGNDGTEMIAQGLASGGFSGGRLRKVEDIDTASIYLKEQVKKGDSVLYEGLAPDDL